MSKYTLIHYPSWSTSVKAKRALESLNVDFEIKNLKTDNPNYEELKEIHKKSNVEVKKLFGVNGTKFKELELKDKLPLMTDDEALKLLATDGMLVKRPMLVGDDFVLIGYKEKEWSDKLNESK